MNLFYIFIVYLVYNVTVSHRTTFTLKQATRQHGTNDNDNASWDSVNSQKINTTISNKRLEVAVDELAQAVAQAVLAIAGDISGLFDLASTWVANFVLIDEKTDNKNESVWRDSETQTILVITLKKTVEIVQAWCPCFQCNTYKLTVSGTIIIMRPRNQAAQAICDKLISVQAGHLMHFITTLGLFSSGGSEKQNAETPVSVFVCACERRSVGVLHVPASAVVWVSEKSICVGCICGDG